MCYCKENCKFEAKIMHTETCYILRKLEAENSDERIWRRAERKQLIRTAQVEK